MANPKQTAHTPTPWRTRVMGSEGCRIFPDTGDKREDMKFIAMVNGRDLPVDTANSEFIVRAVNSHAALVEALEAIKKKVGMAPDEEIYAIAEAALKAARGE